MSIQAQKKRLYFQSVVYALITSFLIAPLPGSAQTQLPLSTFNMQDVRLLPGIFKEAESTDMKYMLAMEPDRLLAPYLREAGLTPKAESYTNWENTGLDGHIGGHYLSALALMYAATGNKQLLERLNYMISELKNCQDKNGDGYIGGVPGSQTLWAAVRKGDVEAIRRKWVPFYNIHKTYAGIRDAYLYAGNQEAKKMLVKFSDWFVQLSLALTEQKMQDMLRIEHGGINEVLADVFAITGNKEYLAAAYKFSHKAILEPLEKNQDKLNNLHANTQIPKVIGFKRIADLNRDSAYNNAARFFWETVVMHRTVAIGGNSVREHFHPSGNFSSMITSEQGPETCNTYNMLRLTKLLYLSEPIIRYIDYYERALYNHILASQHPGKGGFVYFTPMRPGHYRVYSQPQTSMWCCVGSGMENHAKYNELIYAHDNDNLYINLFIPSRLTWKQKKLILTQQTLFPEKEKTIITIATATPQTFTINIRYPSWVEPGALKISVNGKTVKIDQPPSSYIAIKRTWKKEDKIEVHLPMRIKTEQLPDASDYVAVLYGPVILAAKTDTTNMQGLFADDSRMGHVANGKQVPLLDMPVFVSNNKDIASQISIVPGKSLVFSARSLIYPDIYRKLVLIPFFQLHDSRYVLYWQTATPEKLKEIQQNSAKQEAEKQKLATHTIDMVFPGEQQPESDHFIESENSNTGVNKDKYWRDARGWFSYKLADKEKKANKLCITYFGLDRDRRFKILVNNEVIAAVMLDGTHGDDFYTVDYILPEKIVRDSDGILTVKFLATDNSVAGGIYEVRLLKK